MNSTLTISWQNAMLAPCRRRWKAQAMSELAMDSSEPVSGSSSTFSCPVHWPILDLTLACTARPSNRSNSRNMLYLCPRTSRLSLGICCPRSSNGTFILLVCTSSTSPAHLWLFRTPATSCYPHEQTQRLSFTRLHGSLLAEYSHAVGTRYALHPTYASLFGLAMGQSVVGR